MKNVRQYETFIDPITLWKLIHGGDPVPPEVLRLTSALAIYSLAANLKGGDEIKAASIAFVQKQLAQAR